MKYLILLLSLLFVFKSNIYAQPSHDECTNPIIISNLTSAQTLSVNLSGATESIDGSCEDSTLNNLDVWYQFTMPFDGKLRVTNVHGVNYISLYDTCGGTELACFRGNGYADSLQNGVSYLIRYSSSTMGLLNDNITVKVFSEPANDDCANAILVPNINTQQVISLDNQGAHESLDASCDDMQDEHLDLWYKFIMPYDGKIKVSGLSIIQSVSLYDQCGGIELACMYSTGFINELVSGQEYYLRYATIARSANNNNLSIQAFAPPC